MYISSLMEEYFELTYKGKNAGKIQMSIWYQVDGMNKGNNQNTWNNTQNSWNNKPSNNSNWSNTQNNWSNQQKNQSGWGVQPVPGTGWGNN